MPGNWTRALTKYEINIDCLHRERQMISCYFVSLTSSKELQRCHFEKSLIDLQRRVPTLQLGIASRNGQLWFHSRDDDVVDLEIRKDGTPEFLVNELVSHAYESEENPLWVVRVLANNLTNEGRYSYDIFFRCHHSTTDGYSNVYIWKLFLQLLNNSLDGKESPHDQLGVHVSDEQTREMMQNAEYEVSQQLAEGLSFMEIVNVKPVSVVQLFDPPLNEDHHTFSITRVITNEDTLTFVSLCRQNGVSFHSAFCTIINIAITHFLMELDIDRGVYEIPSLHSINLRRYWKADSQIKLGAHVSSMPITATIPKTHVKDTWHCAKQFQKEFARLLEAKTALICNAYCDVKQTKKTTAFPFYYITSNMGCLDSYFGMNQPYTIVTGLERHVSCSGSYPIVHQMQTVNGNFVHSIDCNAKFVTKKSALLYSDKIFDVFRASLVC